MGNLRFDKPRFVRFHYLSNDSRGRNRWPHMLRDESCVIELMPALQSLGYDYGGLFINAPPRSSVDTSKRDFASMKPNGRKLDERDILLLTCRPPCQDKYSEKKALHKSGSDFEVDLFKSLKLKCFDHCSRGQITLIENICRWKSGYQNRADIKFEVKGQQASYIKCHGERGKIYQPYTKNTTAGYLVHIPLGHKMPKLLACFSLSGTMSLTFCHLLSKRKNDIERVLEKPRLFIYEIVRNGPIPCEEHSKGFHNLDFCLKWTMNIIGECDL